MSKAEIHADDDIESIPGFTPGTKARLQGYTVVMHDNLSQLAPNYRLPKVSRLSTKHVTEDDLQDYLMRVYGYHQQARRQLLDWRVRLGAILIQIRAQRPFGTWREWLGMMSIHYKTAQRAIKLAERLADTNGELDKDRLKSLVMDEAMREKLAAMGGDLAQHEREALNAVTLAEVEKKIALRKRHNMQMPRGGGIASPLYDYAGRNATPAIVIDGEQVQGSIPALTRMEYSHTPSVPTLLAIAGSAIPATDREKAIMADAYVHSRNLPAPAAYQMSEQEWNRRGRDGLAGAPAPIIRPDRPALPEVDNSPAIQAFAAGCQRIELVFKQCLGGGQIESYRVDGMQVAFRRFGKSLKEALIGNCPNYAPY